VWNWHYQFGVDRDPDKRRAYGVLTGFDISGEPIRPTGLRATRVELHVSPHEDVATEEKRDDRLASIGWVSLSGETLQGYVRTPTGTLPLLLQLLSRGQLGYIVMRGEKLRYRRASLNEIDFCKTLDESEDLPD
jgi:hypothetical protein